MIVFQLYLIFAFALISVIHIYWASGGKWGIKSAIPENENGPLFEATPLPTFVIASLFACGVLLVALDAARIHLFVLQNYLYPLIVIVFASRAIGEFRYVGLFKKIRDTDFARNDNRIYVPLCLSIAASALILRTL